MKPVAILSESEPLGLSGPLLASCALALIALLFGCSGEVASSPSSLAGSPNATVLDPAAGVGDLGDDPAVVAIVANGAIVCAGSLIAPDVVLTARHCVLLHPASSGGGALPACPPSAAEALSDPTSLGVQVGDSDTIPEIRAHARSVLVVAGSGRCDADIAALMLDRTIDDIEPLAVRSTGVAKGDRVRTVGFGPGGGPLGTKIVRDHVEVVQTDRSEFRLREEGCEYGCGGPTIDESTAQIVGVLSGPGSPPPSAEGGSTGVASDIGTRADAFSALVKRALAEGAPIRNGAGRAKTKKGAVDMGANCQSAIDCAAGVCVTYGSEQYCSRTCSAHDRCPARFRCERTGGPDGLTSACIES